MRLRVKRANVTGAKKKSSAISKAVKAAITMAARRDTNQYVPYQEHRLQGTAYTQSDLEEGELVYGDGSVPYAKPQYYGCPNKSHPETTMRWFEHAKPQYLPIWLKEGEQAAKEAAKHG